MNIRVRIQELEAELDCMGIKAWLTYHPDGIEVRAETEVDRLLAMSELRKMNVQLREG